MSLTSHRTIDIKTNSRSEFEIKVALAFARACPLPNAPFTCSCHGPPLGPSFALLMQLSPNPYEVIFPVLCMLNALLLSNCHTSFHVVVPILKVSRAHVCNQSFRSRARASCSKIFVRLWRIESESFT